MKNKIVTGLLLCMVSVNVIGCGGCGTTQEETSVVAEMEETEKVIEVTEVMENTEEDYADSLVEVEGGDGEDSTETDVVTEEVVDTEVTEETPNLGYVLTECSPQIKYTNTNANIRATPDKSGTLVNTVPINTEFQVTATTDTGWSRIESNGIVCFIKSSLLSDTKTEVKQPSSSSSGSSSSSSNQSQSSQNTDSNGGTSQSNQSEQKALEDALSSLGWTESGDVVMGSGDTGGTTDGHYGGVQ